MTAPFLRPGWYALATSRELKAMPLRRVFNGVPLVLWRTTGGVAALKDYCPHRGAPLSKGVVLADAIACPYHGWRFDRTGRCVATPALADRVLKAPVEAFSAAEADGLVFVRWGRGDAAPDFAPLIPGVDGASLMRGQVRTSLADIAENILDTTHTGVVHQGYLRRSGGRRITPRVDLLPDAAEAHYPPAATPSGFVGRMIGGPRYRIVDRFRGPSQAEGEYWEDDRLAFSIRFHLTPTSPGHVAAFARMAVRRGPLAPARRWLLRVLLSRIFREDRRILQLVADNRAAFEGACPTHAPQDLLRPAIEAILAGEPPRAASVTPELLI